jgi:hypothetical protein
VFERSQTGGAVPVMANNWKSWYIGLENARDMCLRNTFGMLYGPGTLLLDTTWKVRQEVTSRKFAGVMLQIIICLLGDLAAGIA